MIDQYKQQFDSMMQREISRGEFLKIMGIVLLGFTGVIGFLKNLHESVPVQKIGKKHTAPSAYGGSAYGR